MEYFSSQYNLYCSNGSVSNDETVSSNGRRFIAQQWTGLLDKNGCEIYEGDLAECDDGIGGRIYGEVIYENVYGNFCISFTDILQWTFRKATNLEVIGNIFKNPELCSTN